MSKLNKVYSLINKWMKLDYLYITDREFQQYVN